MALPRQINDRERLSHIEDVVDLGVNKRVQVMNGPANPIPVTIDQPIDVQVTADSIQSGTVDGTATGTERTFVNNRRNQVLSAHDLVASYVWADFGSKNERVISISYVSATFPGHTITRTFVYSPVGSSYRLDSETWAASSGG